MRRLSGVLKSLAARQLPKLPLGSPVGGRLRAASVFSPEKKTHKKKAPTSPPQLLVQDAETTGRQIQDRLAQLLSEEVEPSSTPPLPTSRILEEELARGSRALRPPGRAQNLLWEASALTGARALESFYTASLVPPLVPQWPAKVCSLPVGQVGSRGEGGGSGCSTKRRGEEAGCHGVESSVLSLQQPDGSHSRNREAHRFLSVKILESSECRVPGPAPDWYNLPVMGPRNKTGLCTGIGTHLLEAI